jgi:hypothetical protein
MFSMAALPLPNTLENMLRNARVVRGVEALEEDVLCTHWGELDRTLPDGGFPKGLVELSAPRGLGGGTSIALSAVRAIHQDRADAHAAWLEDRSAGRRLNAAAVLRSQIETGIDTTRLFVVRADAAALSRAVVKVVESGAFGVVCVSGAAFGEREARRIQMAARETGAVVLALTDSFRAHAPWPSVLTLSLLRQPETIHVRVTKERRGRIGQRVMLKAAA